MRPSRELGLALDLLAWAAGLPGRPGLDARREALARGDALARRGTLAQVDWARWLDLVDEHQLGPLLGSRFALGREQVGPLPEPIARALVERYARSGHEASFRSAELVRTLALIGEEDAPIVLKGSALVFTLYGEAAERLMSDLDLLFVDHEAIARAEARLFAAGWTRPEGGERPAGPHHHVPPLVHAVREQQLELHTNLATPGLPDRELEALWARARTVALADGRRVRVLDPVSALLHHAVHAVADPIDSPLLRNLFEVAWLLDRLDAAEKEQVVERAARWGALDRVRLAVGLAAELFGGPPLLAPPRLDLRARWALARLEWTRAFDPEAPPTERFLRHLARVHLRAIDRGASTWSPLPLAGLAASAVLASVRARLPRGRPLRLGLGRPGALGALGAGSGAGSTGLTARPVPRVLVDGCLLAHDPDSGAVHLLDRTSTRVWCAAADGAAEDALLSRLAEEGISGDVAAAALERLVAAGLLARSRPRQTATAA